MSKMTPEQWQEISDRNARAHHYVVNACEKISKELEATPFWRIFKTIRLFREFGIHNRIAKIAGEETLEHIKEWQKDIKRRQEENEKELAELNT